MASRGRAIPNSNATSISLHERFSRLRTPGAASVKAATKTQVRRQNAALTQLASSKNKRLIAQLEKRAALNTAVLKIKKKSIKQRLGVQPTFSTRPKLRGSLSQPQRNLSTKRGKAAGNTQLNRNQGPAGKPSPKNKASLKGKIAPKSATKQASVTRQTQKPNVRGRNPKGNGRGRGKAGTTKVSVNNQGGKSTGRTQTSTRGVPNSRGRGRGRGRGGRGGSGGGQTPKVSKEDLDKQLDQYMSGTRHTLDQEIDSYMNLKDVEMN